MNWLHSAAVLAFIAVSAPAHAEGMIRATCTSKGGGTVHRQDLPEDASARERLAIAAAYPDAMCLFLKIADLPPEHRVPRSPSIPDDVLQGALEGAGTPDDSLAAALSVLSGRDETPTVEARTFSNGFDSAVSLAEPEKERSKPLNLTVGLYRSVPMEDVMAHWKVMQEGTRILARMTPSMSVVGDVTMLSIENVPDSEAAKLCEEAALKGAGCIAVY